MWSASAENEQASLTHYKIYQLIDGEKILKGEVAASTRSYLISGLTSGAPALFAVTALRNDGQESGHAYTLTVIPE